MTMLSHQKLSMLLLSIGGALSLGVAGCGEEAAPEPQELFLGVSTTGSDGAPVEMVRFLINGKKFGMTDDRGQFRGRFQAVNGDDVTFSIEVPKGYIAPAEFQKNWRQQAVIKPEGQRSELNFSAVLYGPPRNYGLVVKTELPNNPVEVDGKPVGETGADGVAFLSVEGYPGMPFTVRAGRLELKNTRYPKKGSLVVLTPKKKGLVGQLTTTTQLAAAPQKPRGATAVGDASPPRGSDVITGNVVNAPKTSSRTVSRPSNVDDGMGRLGRGDTVMIPAEPIEDRAAPIRAAEPEYEATPSTIVIGTDDDTTDTPIVVGDPSTDLPPEVGTPETTTGEAEPQLRVEPVEAEPLPPILDTSADVVAIEKPNDNAGAGNGRFDTDSEPNDLPTILPVEEPETQKELELPPALAPDVEQPPSPEVEPPPANNEPLLNDRNVAEPPPVPTLDPVKPAEQSKSRSFESMSKQDITDAVGDIQGRSKGGARLSKDDALFLGKVERSHPKYYEANRLLGGHYFRLKDYAKQASALEIATKRGRYKHDPMILLSLAKAYAYQKKYDSALRQMRKVESKMRRLPASAKADAYRFHAEMLEFEFFKQYHEEPKSANISLLDQAVTKWQRYKTFSGGSGKSKAAERIEKLKSLKSELEL